MLIRQFEGLPEALSQDQWPEVVRTSTHKFVILQDEEPLVYFGLQPFSLLSSLRKMVWFKMAVERPKLLREHLVEGNEVLDTIQCHYTLFALTENRRNLRFALAFRFQPFAETPKGTMLCRV